jgi:alpha-L-fucosidase
MYLMDNPVFQHHVATYGSQESFGYKDFIPRFTAEKFDPDHWAQLFRRAGAKFVVPVAEHHDGFQMYDSSLSPWNALQMGPKRDVLGLIAGATRRHGMVFGASSHRAEHWWFFEGGMQFNSDVKEPENAAFYGPAVPRKTGFGDESQPSQAFMDDWLARTAEIVEKYRPQIVWFDWWIEQSVFAPYRQKFAAYYYNRAAEWRRPSAINYKFNAFPEKTAVLDVERGQLDGIRPQFWQTDTSISKKSWGYIRNDEFKTADSIIDDLVDIVSKNGALLLNIGPLADGTIPEEAERILLEIGRWLEVNGEAIYGSSPWKVFGEGPTQVVAGSFKDTERGAFTSTDFRFTAKGGTLYAIALAWPQDGKLMVKSLAEGAPYWSGPVGRVELLGSKAALRWTRSAEGLAVDLPTERPCENALVLKISGAGSTGR